MTSGSIAANTVVFTGHGFAQGAWRIFPIAVGGFLFALVYGLVAQQKGISFIETLLMSLTVFAGASQMVAVQGWDSPVPIGALVLAVLTVNIRHILMGAALVPWLDRQPRWRALGSLFFMTDEVWGVSIAEMNKGSRDAGFFLGAGVTLYVFWVLGSATGRIFGGWVPDPGVYGLTFLAVGPFVALLGAVWRRWTDIPGWLVSGGLTLALGYVLPGTWPILFGALTGSLIGAWLDVRRNA